jgi:hypothetical protein
MITRKSFFVRWIIVSSDDKAQQEHSVIDIEHIQNGSSRRVSSLEEAAEWMRDAAAEPETVKQIKSE